MDPKLHKDIKDARMIWKRRAGEFGDYERAVVKAYDQAIQKLSREQFEAAAQAVFEEYKDQTYTYTRDLIEDLKNQGYLLFAISGSQKEIVSLIAGYYGFDDNIGSSYEYLDGRFTGAKEVASWVKGDALNQLISKYGASTKDSIGVGDTYSDIPMLEITDNPIAFNPDRRLFEAATAKGWKIVIERKNVIYELEKGDDRYELA